MQQCNVSHSKVGIVASGYAMLVSDIGVSGLKCTASHCQRRTHMLSYQTSYNIRGHIKKIISGQTVTRRQSAVVILCETCIT